MTIRNDATRETLRLRDARRPRGVVARQGQVLLDTDIAGLAGLTLDRVELADADLIGSPGRLAVPAGADGFKVTGVTAAGGGLDATIGAGRGYLGGWLLENPADATLAATQPHPWTSPAAPLPAVVGLKAVVRLIDPVEDNALADRALGNAQASGRSLIDWQAFALPVVAGAAPLTCADVLALPAWQELTRPSSGRLQFIKADPPASTDPCSLSEQGGYTRLENLLYRVEVHRGVLGAGAPDPAIDGPRYRLQGLQLKLSRCNGSILARIDQVAGRVFTVSPAALDPRNWFAEGQLAELVSIHDDVDTAAGHATERLFRVARVTDDEVELVDRSATDTVAKVGAAADGAWFLRMWESLPDAGEVATVALDGSGAQSTVIPLGDGVAIQLQGDAAARFRRGDYWTCAMRADGEIDWPAGQFEPPAGPERRYAPLAVVNAGPAVEDCLIVLATLSDRLLLYRGGDGQEAMPDPTKPTQRVPLASPLRVAVMRGEQPVAGVQVVFELKDLPAGKTAELAWPAAGATQTGTSVTATTDANGLVEVAWDIDPTVPEQRVAVRLIGTTAAAPLIFTANLSVAGEVGFDPKAIPVFAGITDVQRALEALAGMQQAGCATYVLTPANWLATLAGLKPGEDAKLCFQRGLFVTKEAVALTGLGHLTLCGAGEATVIRAEQGECVLSFERCASVHLGEVAIAAPAGRTKEHQAGRNGTLTLLDCPVVEVTGATVSCGAQALTERTCITVRGTEGKPLRWVRVAHNRLEVGFNQDGVLVTEAEHCVIEGNEIVAADLPDNFDRTRVLLSRAFQPALLRALVPDARAKAVPGAVTPSPFSRLLSAGAFHAAFASPVPQPVWDKLLADNPPAAADQASAAAFGKYVEGLFDKAVASTDTVRRFAPNIARLERASAQPFSPQLRAAMLRTTDIRVSDAAPVVAPPVAMASAALNEEGWRALLTHVPSATAAVTPDHLRKAARMALADQKLRGKVAGLGKWFEGRAAAVTALGRQAITVGGRQVGDAIVTNNRVTGFAQGVHVGASFANTKREAAAFRSVTVAGNLVAMRTLGDTTRTTAGLFVGNAETVRIADNLLEPADAKELVNATDGIRVWGRIGRFLAIEKNRVGVGRIAIRIKPTEPPDDGAIARLMWLAADNLGAAHAPAQVLKAPSWVERRFNRP